MHRHEAATRGDRKGHSQRGQHPALTRSRALAAFIIITVVMSAMICTTSTMTGTGMQKYVTITTGPTSSARGYNDGDSDGTITAMVAVMVA